MVVADVGSEEDCVRLVNEAVELLGGVDVLILNAAYAPDLEWFSSDNDVMKYIHAQYIHAHLPSMWHTHSASLLKSAI